MKYFATVATAATALLSLAAPSAANPVEKRTPGGVTICTGANYSGDCTYQVVSFNQCNILQAPYLKSVGTFAPDTGALCRITYTADSCTLHGDAFVQYPGVTDLYSYTDVNGNTINAGNSMTSFLCQECTACT